MVIGDIIRVENAQTYVAKIPPDVRKERIGTFIKIKKDDGLVIGVISNISNSIREDLIPYIDPAMQPKYAPFNEDFRNSYYFIHGLGTVHNGIVKYEINSPPDLGDNVELPDPGELKLFHTRDGKPSIAYFHANSDKLSRNVLISMTEHVEEQFPECKAMLKLVRKHIGSKL